MPSKTFSAFCNRVEAVGKTYKLLWMHKSLPNWRICYPQLNSYQETMLTDWYLIDLRTNGIKYESAAAGAEKISEVHINKLGAYLYRKLTDKGKQPEKLSDPEKKCQSIWFEIYSWAHKWCKTINAECSHCKKIGHFS